MLLGNRPILDSPLGSRGWQKGEYLELFCKGQELPLNGSSFWQVYRGVVQLYRVGSEGKETLLGWVTANHAFGAGIVEGDFYRAVALTEVYIRRYSTKESLANPALSRLLISELSYRLIKSEQMVAINLIRRVEDRLKALINLLKDDLGHPRRGNIRLSARLTHQNLADAICTTRVTVTRILGNWQSEGLIEFDCDRHLIIKF